MPWLYPYRCPCCGAYEERLKPAIMGDQPEFCEADGHRLLKCYNKLKLGLVPHMVKYSDDWRDPLSATDRLAADKEADKRYEESWKAKELDGRDKAIGGVRVG